MVGDPADGSASALQLRIIYVSNESFYSRAQTRLKALRQLGHQVEFISSGGEWLDAQGRTRRSVAGILQRFGIEFDFSGASSSLRNFAKFAPDLIWIDRSPMLSPSALRTLRKHFPEAMLLAFSEDDLALRHNQSLRWLAALPIYDVVLTTKIRNVELGDLASLGAREVRYTRQAFDPEQQFPIELDANDLEAFGADVSFVGSYEAERGASILRLCEGGVPVRVWGSGWLASGIRHPLLRIEGREAVNRPHNLAYTKVINASKINLGFLRKLNRDQHTSRTLEIPACRAFMLAERTHEHCEMFAEGSEAEFFGDDGELLAKVLRYLQDEPRRLNVAEAGYSRCLREYTNLRQVKGVLDGLDLPRPRATNE
jgi:spore maturation protein CgeB